MGVLVVPGTLDSALAGVLDVLRAAERLRPPAAAPGARVRVRVLGPTRRVRTAGGLAVRTDGPLDRAALDADVLVLPAPAALTTPELDRALDRTAVRDVVARLAASVAPVPVLAAAGTAALVLARSGRLDGRRAATTAWVGETLRRRHPAVRLDPSRTVLVDGCVVTAALPADLALGLLAGASPDLAHAVAHRLGADEQAVTDMEADAAADELVRAFETWVAEHLDEPFSVAEAADAVGATPRTLERHTRRAAGRTPQELIAQRRLARARRLRRAGARSWDEIAPLVGYGSGAALRRRLRASG